MGPRRQWTPPETKLIQAPELEAAPLVAPKQDLSGGATAQLVKQPTPVIPVAPADTAAAPAADTGPALVENKQAPKMNWKNYLGSGAIGALAAGDLGLKGMLGAGVLSPLLMHLLRGRGKGEPKAAAITKTSAKAKPIGMTPSADYPEEAAQGGTIGEPVTDEPVQAKRRGGVIRKRPKGSKAKEEKAKKAKKAFPPPVAPYPEEGEVEPAAAAAAPPMPFAAGGVAKIRRGFPNTNAKPKKFAKGGSVRGTGIAQRGTNFSGCY